MSGFYRAQDTLLDYNLHVHYSRTDDQSMCLRRRQEVRGLHHIMVHPRTQQNLGLRSRFRIPTEMDKVDSSQEPQGTIP